jgi:exodeoxyribonuclease VII large subunit
VPDRTELAAQLSMTGARMKALVSGYLSRERRYFTQLSGATVFQKPERVFDGLRMKLSEREAALDRAASRCVDAGRNRLTALCGKLDAMNPLAVLARGYAAVGKEGRTVTRAAELSRGDQIEIRFADGCVGAVIEHEKGMDKDA